MISEKLRQSFLAIITCLLWSSAFAGIKIGLPFTTPLQFAGTRFFISGLLVLPVALYYNPNFLGVFRANIRFILLIGLMQTFLQYALFYTGIDMVPGAVGAIVIGSGPLFIAIVAHFFVPGDQINMKKAMIILFGFSGVVLVSLGRNGEVAGESLKLIGILILIGNNIISGISNVIIALEKKKIPPLVLSSASMIFGGGLLFLFSIPIEGWAPSVKPLPYYLSLGWLSILSAVAISLWVTLLKKPGIVVSELNMWKFLIPVVGAILAWILLPAESPDWISIVGMIITGVALIFISRQNMISNRVEQDPVRKK